MDGDTPGLVVLGVIKKQIEQTIGGKPVSSNSPWILLEFLSMSSCLDFS